MKKFHATVVGGGIAGILSALQLTKLGAKVCLVESEAEIGGLLRSYNNSDGASFDYGTHFIPELAQPEINDLLSISAHDDWNTITSLKVSTYSNGYSYNKSSYSKPQHLTEEMYTKALEDFRKAPEYKGTYQDLNDYFERRYGRALNEEIFTPIVRKIHGKNTQELSTELARIFQLNRVILFTEEETNQLKKNTWFDDRLAHHTSVSSPTPIANYYPNTGGVGAWIEILKQKLIQDNVELYVGAKVESIQSESKSITTVNLENGHTIETNHLVWTIPSALLCRALSIPTNATRPQFIQSSLTFLSYEEQYLTPSYYLLNHDEAHQSYRVTLFDNFSSNVNTNKRICLESFQPDEQATPTPDRINSELIQMGVIPEHATPTYQRTVAVRNGFPVMHNGLISNIKNINHSIHEQIDNVTLCGKASGNAFFMTDTLADTYQQIQEISL